MGIESIVGTAKKVVVGAALALGLSSTYSGCDSGQEYVIDKESSLYEQKVGGIDSLGNVAWGLRNNYPDSAIKVAQLELEKAKEIEHVKGIADAYIIMGVTEKNRGNYEKALENYNHCLEIKKENNDRSGIAATLSNIGNVLHKQGKYSDATKNFIDALKIYEELSDDFGISSTNNNLGKVFEAQGKYDKALDYYFEDLKISESFLQEDNSDSEAKISVSVSLNNIANVFDKQDKSKEAFENYSKSLEYAIEASDSRQQADCYNNIGDFHERRGKLDSALFYYEKSLEINEVGESKDRFSRNLLNIGVIYGKKGNSPKSLDYLLRSFDLADEIGNLGLLKEISEKVSQSYESGGKFEEALEYLKNYSGIKDTLHDKESSRQIAEMDAKYQTSQKEKENIKLQAENDTKQAWMWGIGTALLIATGFGAYSRKQYLDKRKQKEITDEKNVTLEKQKKIIEEKNKDIQDSINYARRIQEAILPPENLIKRNLEDSFVLYKPKDVVAGDFYWMETLEDKVLYAAADCTGHGIPGAMVSMVCSRALTSCVNDGIFEPAMILDRTRELVIEGFEKSEENIKDGMDIALCSLDRKNLELQYAGAHNSLYLLRDNEIIETKADKQPIGAGSVLDPFTNHVIPLKKGDIVYTFSDGFADQFGGPKGKKFMYKKFRDLLIENHRKPMSEQKEILDKTIEDWRSYNGEKPQDQIDDILVMGVRV